MPNLPKIQLTSLAENTMKFGEHLIFDAYKCNPKKLDDLEFCKKVLNDLVELAKMHKLMEPYLLRADGNTVLGGKDPGGISAFVMIEESHISLHTFTKRGFVTLDLYSCNTFDSTGIVEYLKNAFETTDYSILKFDRGLKYPTENIYD